MNCCKVKQKLVFYADGSLDETEKREIEQHLKQCDACAADYRLTVSMIDAAKKIEVPEHDENFWKIQYDLILSRAEQKHHRRTFIKTFHLASGIIGVVLLFFVSKLYIEKNRPINFINESGIVYNITDDVLPENKIPIPVEQLQNAVDFLDPEDHMILLGEFLR